MDDISTRGQCPGPVAREVSSDFNETRAVARQAREALAHGRGAMLEVVGVDAAQQESVPILLHDENGRPTFVCDSPSAAGDWVGRHALLTLTAGRPSAPTGTVVLSGHLIAQTSRQPVVDVVVLELIIEQVIVQQFTLGHEDDDFAVVVPKDLYEAADPDPFVSHGNALAAHANEHHEPQLRAFAVEQARVHRTTVIAAVLTDVNRYGSHLHWIDTEGSHCLDLPFERPAEHYEMLDCLLAHQLGAHGDHL